jgi:hypothetical protein
MQVHRCLQKANNICPATRAARKSRTTTPIRRIRWTPGKRKAITIQGGGNNHDDLDDNHEHLECNDEDDAEDHCEGGPEQQVNSTEMATEFSAEPDSSLQNFFVTADTSDPEVSEQVGGLDLAVNEPASITSFLTLPTVTRQRHTKIRDPIFDFAQSKILTSEEYTTTTEKLKLAKEMVERAKEQQCCKKQDLKRRRAMEREEGRLAKAAAHEEATRFKELHAAKQAELQARKHAMRMEAQRIRVQRLADAVVAKAEEKARKATERQEQQRFRIARAAEMEHRSQGGGTGVDTIATELEVLPTQIPSSIPEHVLQFPTPQNIPYFFSPPTGFIFICPPFFFAA